MIMRPQRATQSAIRIELGVECGEAAQGQSAVQASRRAMVHGRESISYVSPLREIQLRQA